MTYRCIAIGSRAKSRKYSLRLHNSYVLLFMQLLLIERFLCRKFTTLSLPFDLVFIHDQIVIHGDIKPSNMLLRPIPSPHKVSINGLENCTSSTASEPSLFSSYQPLYGDFSASRFHCSNSVPSESAGTYDFMTPKLFSKPAPDNFGQPGKRRSCTWNDADLRREW